MLISVYILIGAFLLLNILALRQAYLFINFGKPSSESKRKKETTTLWEKAFHLLIGKRRSKPLNRYTPDFPYHTITIQLNNQKIECWHTSGNSKGIVALFHGYRLPKSSLLSEAEGFLKLGYDVFMPDFPAHGESDGKTTTFGYKEAEVVALVVNHIQKIYPATPIILYGESMGAAAVLRAISKFSTTSNAVILESPFASIKSAIESRFHLLGLPSFPFSDLLLFFSALFIDFGIYSFSNIKYAKEIDVPVLILRGGSDEYVQEWETDSIFKNIKSQRQIQAFPGADHESLCKHNPELWQDSVSGFLSSHFHHYKNKKTLE